MEKITNYMRVTKKRKALDADPKAAAGVAKPLVVEKSLAPVGKKAKAEEVVDEDGEIYENGVHVPTFIYSTVKYTRKGVPHKVDETTQRVVDFIQVRGAILRTKRSGTSSACLVQKHYAIPVDFETSKKFGPHSGMTYESRLVRAYKLKLLSLQKNKDSVVPICITCAAEGHCDRDCPDGF